MKHGMKQHHTQACTSIKSSWTLVYNNDPHDLDVKHLTLVLVYFPGLIDVTSFLQLKTHRVHMVSRGSSAGKLWEGLDPTVSSWGLWPQRECHKAFPDSSGHLHKVQWCLCGSCLLPQLYSILNNSYFRICFLAADNLSVTSWSILLLTVLF